MCKIARYLKKNSTFTDAELESISLDTSLSKASISRQQEFLRGRWCAQQALLELGDTSPVLRAKDRSPIWPMGFVGSISHNKEYSGAFVALDKYYRSVGMDIEEIGRIKPEMKKMILSSTEQQRFVEQKEMTIIFSAKESLYKLLYPLVKEFFGFQDAEITHLERGKFTILLLKNLGEFSSGTRFQGSYELLDGHILTQMELLHP